MFFVFEGIDGSGKSTQARRLAESLRAASKTVVTVREPGGTALGERIRELLFEPGSEGMAAETPRAMVVTHFTNVATHHTNVVTCQWW